MIKIDHATFTYGENNEYSVGIRDIDLEIEDGQVIVLCGESGCGKTTLTRMINGLIPHYYEGKLTGEIWINGINVSQQPLYDTAKIVGSVFQNPEGDYAGKIIESLGLKNFHIKDAYISEKHANFIINKGSATSKDILELIKIIKDQCKREYNINLKLEQEIINENLK